MAPRFTRHALAAAMLLAFSSLTAASVVDDAKKLLTQGQPAKGMELLEANLAANAQDVEFNYLLGIAALDAGKPGKAVFAFERALALDPGHPQARAELARALAALGEYEAARSELKQVREQNPPPEVRKTVDAALADLERTIAESKQQKTTTWAGFVEVEAGYDTNINTAPNATSIFIPALGLPGTLSGFATAQKSGLLGANAGGSVVVKVGEGLDLFGSVNARLRWHDFQDFAIGSAFEIAGLRYTAGKDQYSLGLSRFDQYLAQYHNDAQNGVYAEWRRELAPTDVVGAFAQYLEATHPITPFLDTNLIIGGATWTHAFVRQGDPLVNFTAYLGDDKAVKNNPTVNRQLYGASMRGEYKLADNLKLLGSVSLQHSDYEGQNVWFRTQRRDNRYDGSLALAWKIDRLWTATPQYLYTRNESTVKFNEFDRHQYLVTIRRDFY